MKELLTKISIVALNNTYRFIAKPIDAETSLDMIQDVAGRSVR